MIRRMLSLSAVWLVACSPSALKEPASILLFRGAGSSPNGVKAMESILKSRGQAYSMVDSEQLNHLSESDLRAYRLLIVPGGNYITMGNGLTPEATAKVRRSVESGLNYLGVCAGGLLAGEAGSNSLNLTAGVRFGFYREVNRGIHKAAVVVTGVDGSSLEHYWEDGPQFAGWGSVVGTYPDGTPAVVEGNAGKGRVILCGVHPEAPEGWRRGMSFNTPTEVANRYAATLIEAALTGSQLPHF